MLSRLLLVLSLAQVHALAKPIQFVVPCGALIASEFRAVPGMIVNADFDVRANAALSEGRPLEALELVEKAIGEWKEKYGRSVGGSAEQRKARGSALHGLRWSQMSVLS